MDRAAVGRCRVDFVLSGAAGSGCRTESSLLDAGFLYESVESGIIL